MEKGHKLDGPLNLCNNATPMASTEVPPKLKHPLFSFQERTRCTNPSLGPIRAGRMWSHDLIEHAECMAVTDAPQLVKSGGIHIEITVCAYIYICCYLDVFGIDFTSFGLRYHQTYENCQAKTGNLRWSEVKRSGPPPVCQLPGTSCRLRTAWTTGEWMARSSKIHPTWSHRNDLRHVARAHWEENLLIPPGTLWAEVSKWHATLTTMYSQPSIC